MGGRSSTGGNNPKSSTGGKVKSIDSSNMSIKEIRNLSVRDQEKVLNGLPEGTKVYFKGGRYTKRSDGDWALQGWENDNKGSGKMSSKDVIQEQIEQIRFHNSQLRSWEDPDEEKAQFVRIVRPKKK